MNKYLAFLYNVRHKYPNPSDPKTFLEADFDDPNSIKAMIYNLTTAGFKVLPIEANSGVAQKLSQNKAKIGLVFNFSEIIVGKTQGQQITSVCEKLHLPHTGSADKTQLIIRNKVKAKEVLAKNNLPVLPHQVFFTGNEKLLPNLKFPLIVKPISEGSSAGITDNSIVYNYKNLQTQVKTIIKRFNAPVFVEPFLSGREFSISLLGNPPRILPIIEPDFSHLPKKFKPIDSYEVKWIYEESGKKGSDHFICPPKLDKDLEIKLKQIVLKVWQVLEIKDYCRMDLRCDQQNNPYVLEINSPPGLQPPEISLSSYLPLSARVAGISYQELLKTIITSALKRYQLNNMYYTKII